MSNEFFNNILKYHQNLVDPEFLRLILEKINLRNKKRSNIMLVFTLLGTLATTITMVVLKSSFTFIQSTNNLTTTGITLISLFVVWLIFEETEASS